MGLFDSLIDLSFEIIKAPIRVTRRAAEKIDDVTDGSTGLATDSLRDVERAADEILPTDDD